MFQVQMQFVNAMLEMTTQCAKAYGTLLEGQMQAMAAISGEGHSPADARKAAFDMPRAPKAGQSWYRAPQENPVLAFWDEVLRPWRVQWPAGAAMPGSMGGGMADGMMALSALAFGPWLSLWSNMAPGVAPDGKSFSPAGAAWNWQPASVPTGSASSHLATAKVVFPDKTEVTISFPFMPPFFGVISSR